MTLTPFLTGWTVRSADVETAVTLPHDAMLGETRSRTAPTGSHGAYFPGGRYLYSTTWTRPTDSIGRAFALVFEGVYGRTSVRVDGREVAANDSGYREFAAPLDSVAPGATATIEVDVDNTVLPNSRWYTGSGIYRPVWLEDAPAARIVRDGISVRTTLSGASAVGAFEVDVDVPAGTFSVEVELADADGRVCGAIAPVTSGRASVAVEVPDVRPWSDLDPHRYTATIRLLAEGVVADERQQFVGLRTVQVDAVHGLRVNDRVVTLRGACVHHDSGVLGAATHRAAEFRRARILKAAGFNAVRSSHNPLSRAFVDACDEVGLYVLDELTDVWFQPKTAHDAAPRFEDLWRDDARSMVAKDRLSASVIMYSIGNEIAESGTPRGVETAHAISDFVRELDPDRPTTLALNFLLNVMADSGRSLFNTAEHDENKVERKPSKVTSTVANVMANRIGRMMQLISKLPKADRVSRDTFATVDVAGYNYAWGRYAGDAKKHPKRVVLGTESMPGDITVIWPLVEKLPNLIGDFAWTGWDYLGETGIGSWSYGGDSAILAKAYPELVAGCGLIDITGHPDAALLLTRATWGQLDAPAIAVRPLDRSGQKVQRVAWRSTDAVESWSWRGCEGRRAEIEVYSSDDEVELFLDGRSLGRRRVGRSHVVRFRALYAPGELVAVGYREGVESGRSALSTAREASVRAIPESPTVVADGADLAFVRIALADAEGVVESLDDDLVRVAVEGPAELIGLGSGVSMTEESFLDDVHTTWRGRALAILRSTGEPGAVRVTVSSERHGTATAEVAAVGHRYQNEKVHV
jgi:hypothetical protein